jgi:hypothetical protein
LYSGKLGRLFVPGTLIFSAILKMKSSMDFLVTNLIIAKFDKGPGRVFFYLHSKLFGYIFETAQREG